MEEIEYQWLRDFLGEHYARWEEFLSDRGESEETAEAVIEKLRIMAGL